MSAGALVDRVRREVDERGLPAAQVAIARDREVLLFETVGDAPAGAASRFLIWSCTKGIVASVIWQLVGEGLLDYSRTVASYLPTFATNGKEDITVEQVLLHTAGFPLAPMGPTYWGTTEGRRAAFGRWRLNWEPGSRFQYHETASGWVLSELISEASGGADFREVIHARIRDPLGLSSFALGVPEGAQGDIAPVAVVGVAATDDDYLAAGWKPLAPPTTPPDLAIAMNAPSALAAGIPAGGAVSTAADVALFYQALLHNTGGLWRDDVLADGTSVVRNTFPDVGRWHESANRTRGMVVRGADEPYASLRHHFGPSTSPRAFGHDGAAGQIAWADPESGLSFCFLTSGYDRNRVRELLRNQDLSRLAAEA